MVADFRKGLELAYEREEREGVFHPVVDFLRIWDEVHGYDLTGAHTIKAFEDLTNEEENVKAAQLVASFGHTFKGNSVGLMGHCLMSAAMEHPSPLVRDGGYEALEQWIVDDEVWNSYLPGSGDLVVPEEWGLSGIDVSRPSWDDEEETRFSLDDESFTLAVFGETFSFSMCPPENVGLCWTPGDETNSLMVGDGGDDFVVGTAAHGISLSVPTIPAEYVNAIQACESSIVITCAKKAMPSLLAQYGFSESDTMALFEAVQIRELREPTGGYVGEVVEDQSGPVLFAWNELGNALQIAQYGDGRWNAILWR